MKFLDMVGKRQINIVHQSQAKKGGASNPNGNNNSNANGNGE
jgi:hypothetical protein